MTEWSKEKDISSVNQAMACLFLSAMPWHFLVRKYQVKMSNISSSFVLYFVEFQTLFSR